MVIVGKVQHGMVRIAVVVDKGGGFVGDLSTTLTIRTPTPTEVDERPLG